MPAVLEDDIVLRISLPLLFFYLFVQLVVCIFGLPVAERHTNFVQ